MTKKQCRAAHARLGWTIDGLAERSSTSRGSIRRFESGIDAPRRSMVRLLQETYEAVRIEFLGAAAAWASEGEASNGGKDRRSHAQEARPALTATVRIHAMYRAAQLG